MDLRAERAARDAVAQARIGIGTTMNASCDARDLY
jgi:hypothetical protein